MKTALTPEEVLSMLAMTFLTFFLSVGLWFMWALFAPRTMGGQGSIPDGCGPVQHAYEVFVDKGEHSVCMRDGVSYPSSVR